MPRRKLLDGQARDSILALRLTAKERQLIEEDAKRRGQKPSEHIRRIMLMVARREVLVR